ncbi:hypothetical protein [Neorhodopirellula lusitana]|uniref:hypothetical protein n=1 Tax=Neorhodopirellula lusitana TaxID=445327 RepID=UPI00384DF5AC
MSTPASQIPASNPNRKQQGFMRPRFSIRLLSSCVFVCVFASSSGGVCLFADDISPKTAQLEHTSGQLKMLAMLQKRVADRPDHSESWRTLGRLQQALGDTDSAIASSKRAVELDPFNAAAHFDIGQLFLKLARPEAAKTHFDQVYQIAPASSYADQLRDQGIPCQTPATAHLVIPIVSPNPATPKLDTLPSASNISATLGPDKTVQPIGYQIQSFDGSNDLEQRIDQLQSEVQTPVKRLRAFFETGVLYNSNVTLTPVSRELAQSDSASFQAFANPDFDYKILRTASMRAGPMFRGYFTANESDFQEFNLASFQPGLFGERDFNWGTSEAIGRIEYVYSADYFDGNSVGNRHSATASVTLIRPDLEAFYSYLTIASSDFSDDGVDPTQSSLDGITITAGSSRFFQTGWQKIPMHSIGIDTEWANTDGDDYRYGSINLHGSTGWNISESWKLIPTWGVGYRDYYDFTGATPREELFWRVHGRLQYAINEAWGIATVVGHDRFASDNEDYDTERTEGGFVFTFTR